MKALCKKEKKKQTHFRLIDFPYLLLRLWVRPLLHMHVELVMTSSNVITAFHNVGSHSGTLRENLLTM